MPIFLSDFSDLSDNGTDADDVGSIIVFIISDNIEDFLVAVADALGILGAVLVAVAGAISETSEIDLVSGSFNFWLIYFLTSIISSLTLFAIISFSFGLTTSFFIIVLCNFFNPQ